MSSPEKTPVSTGRFARLRVAVDRVPTKWFAGMLTAAFLAVTAGFGGLADAAADPIATLEVGSPHTTDQLSITVERVVLIDDLPELLLELEPGHRALVVLARVTNEWDQPQPASESASGLRDTLRIIDHDMRDAKPLEIARVDDAQTVPVLQPGVSAPLAFVWSVPSSAFEDGDSVRIGVFDETLYTGTVVTDGQWWDDPVLAATIDTRLTDVGAGAEP